MLTNRPYFSCAIQIQQTKLVYVVVANQASQTSSVERADSKPAGQIVCESSCQPTELWHRLRLTLPRCIRADLPPLKLEWIFLHLKWLDGQQILKPVPYPVMFKLGYQGCKCKSVDFFAAFLRSMQFWWSSGPNWSMFPRPLAVLIAATLPSKPSNHPHHRIPFTASPRCNHYNTGHPRWLLNCARYMANSKRFDSQTFYSISGVSPDAALVWTACTSRMMCMYSAIPLHGPCKCSRGSQHPNMPQWILLFIKPLLGLCSATHNPGGNFGTTQ